MTAAIFLDRDGVLIAERGYVYRRADIVLIEGVATQLWELKQRGYLLIVITNQSGIGRGYYGHSDVFAAHRVIQALLATAEVQLDAFYYCPHVAADACACRKPAPQLLLRAIHDFQVDTAKSYFVGDKDSDLECARRGKVRGVPAPLANLSALLSTKKVGASSSCP